MPFPHLGTVSTASLPGTGILFEYRFDACPIFSPVTAVTGRDGFAVDLTFVQTYSQAQGDV